MAAGDLKQSQFEVAFDFSRSEAGAYLDASGTQQAAAINVPRFDHSAEGAPLGFLVTPGSDLGRQDRTAIDPLILPEALVEGTSADEREATVFHSFIPAGSTTGVIEHRAWYTRSAKALIDQLIGQSGHHLELGVLSGFRENLGGYVRFRGEVWNLTGLLTEKADGAALVNTPAADAKPIIVAGAEAV